jgi:hypothetical protein
MLSVNGLTARPRGIVFSGGGDPDVCILKQLALITYNCLD